MLYVGAQLGVGLYMFIVGLTFDRKDFRSHARSASAVAFRSMAAPLAVTHRMVGRMLKLTYLAPAMLERLLLERVPPTVPVKQLTLLADMDWKEQFQFALEQRSAQN